MFEWFTTIPGILVICGVILLVIAIILFAVSAKKDKKENVINVEENNNIEPVVQNVSVDVQPVQEVVAPVVEAPVVDTNVTDTVVEPIINDVQPAVENTVSNEVVNNEPVINFPAMEEVVNEVNTEVTDNATVYGGEEPVINFSVEEKPVTIYGGNDPLEATQKLPTVEENHIPYGGEYPEIKIDTPVVEPTIEPVQDVVTPMPTVDFNTVSQPEVINIPDIPEITEEPVVMPEIVPTVESTVEPALEEVKAPVVEEL